MSHDSLNMENLASVLLHHLPVAVVIFDPKAHILGHNPRFAEMFGPTAGGAGQSLSGLIEASALQNFLEELSALVKGQQESLEITCRFRNGEGRTDRWMHLRGVPLPADDNRETGVGLFYAVIDDVTNNIHESQRH